MAKTANIPQQFIVQDEYGDSVYNDNGDHVFSSLEAARKAAAVEAASRNDTRLGVYGLVVAFIGESKVRTLEVL